MQQMWEKIRGGEYKVTDEKILFGFYKWKYVKDIHGSQEWKNVSHNVGVSQSWTCETCEKNPYFDFTVENSFKGQPYRILKNYQFETSGEP